MKHSTTTEPTIDDDEPQPPASTLGRLRKFARTRTGKATLVGGTLAVGTGTIAAAALFFATADITGGAKNGQFDLAFVGTPATIAESTTTAVKTAPTITGGNLALPANLSFFPGEKLTFFAYLKPSGTAGYVTGINLPGLPAGYKATLATGCGMEVLPTSTDSTHSVTVEISLDATAKADGAAWTLAPGAGITATPTTQITKPAANSCAAYVGGQ